MRLSSRAVLHNLAALAFSSIVVAGVVVDIVRRLTVQVGAALWALAALASRRS